MTIRLLNILFGLGAIWMLLGIVCLLQLLRTHSKKSDKYNTEKPTVTRKQEELGSHILIGKSKPVVSSIIPVVSSSSSSLKAVDNPNTFAEHNAPKERDIGKETEGLDLEESDFVEEENELPVAYTMDEPYEVEILREELQIANEAMPEVAPTAILTRDLDRISRWSKNDDSIVAEDETTVTETFFRIRGTELIKQLKEHTLQQKEVHNNILFAIRKVEEEESDWCSTPEVEYNKYNENESNPLSYYL